MSDGTTPIVCESCGGAPIPRESCRHCDRTGQMTRDQLLRYRTLHEGRLTGQYVAFRQIAADIVRVLDKRRVGTAKALATEGRAILDEIDRADTLPSGHQSRSDAIKKLIDFQRRALAYLSGNR